MKKFTLIFVLLMSFSLVACGIFSSPDTYTVTPVTEYFITPEESYIIESLGKVPYIVEIEAVTEETDVNARLNEEDGYYSATFFSVDLLNQFEIHGDGLLDKGTDAGGCIELFRTENDAKSRNDYLGNFDGGPFDSGYHVLIGTTVLRLSNELSIDQQVALADYIVSSISNNDLSKLPEISKISTTSSAQPTEPSVTNTPESAVETTPILTFTPEYLVENYDEFFEATKVATLKRPDMRELLMNVGIYQVVDIENVRDNGAGIITVQGYAYRENEIIDHRDIEVRINIENGVIYLVSVYCPSYNTSNQTPLLSGLKDRRADLYYDVEGGYLKKIDWESMTVVDYE